MESDARPAEAEDIAEIARLFLLASCGIVEAVYDGAEPGVSVAQAVEQRLRGTGTRSYRNFLVAVQGRRIVGMLHAFPIDDAASDPPEAAVPRDRLHLVEPLQRLSERAAGTYHVNAMAVWPAYQGQGIGTMLLTLARRDAEARGLPQVSLVVFEANRRAVRLYRRLGFEEAARRPAARHPLIRHGGDLLLMIRAA